MIRVANYYCCSCVDWQNEKCLDLIQYSAKI